MKGEVQNGPKLLDNSKDVGRIPNLSEGVSDLSLLSFQRASAKMIAEYRFAAAGCEAKKLSQ